MIRRVRVVRAPTVEEWLAAPHRDPGRATTTRVRFAKAVPMIEHAGQSVRGDVA